MLSVVEPGDDGAAGSGVLRDEPIALLDEFLFSGPNCACKPLGKEAGN